MFIFRISVNQSTLYTVMWCVICILYGFFFSLSLTRVTIFHEMGTKEKIHIEKIDVVTAWMQRFWANESVLASLSRAHRFDYLVVHID